MPFSLRLPLPEASNLQLCLDSFPAYCVCLWSFLLTLSLVGTSIIWLSGFFLSIKKERHLFGCARSYSQHIGSLVVACKIWFPDQGIKPRPAALRSWSLSLWTSKEAPQVFLFLGSSFILHQHIFKKSSKGTGENFPEYCHVLRYL